MKLCTKCQSPRDNKSSWCKSCKAKHESARRRDKGAMPKRFRQEKDGLLECLECLEFLDASTFNDSSRGSFGKSSYCKDCQKTRDYPSRKLNKEAVKRYRAKGTYRANHRLREFKRKSRIEATSDGSVTKDFVLGLLAQSNCTYCKLFVEEKDRTIDHVIPLNKNGAHTSDNLVMACLSCNSKKRDLDLEEFLEKYELPMQNYSGLY